jgi:hypothetical protein
MTITIETDDLGRYVCRLTDDDVSATATSSNVPQAGQALLQAIEDARSTGYGECQWDEQGGDYRWMFKRDGDRLTVAVMWCHGVITGWQHVFRADGDFDSFDRDVSSQLERLGVAGSRPQP